MKLLSRRGLFGGAAGCIACGAAHLGFSATPAQAQAQAPAATGGGGWTPPASAQRCPSKWGANDRRGSMNLMTAERAKRAASLIRTGEIVELGQTLSDTMPFFGTRRFDVHLKRTFMNPQANRRGSNEEVVTAEIGQVGTQLDMFPHQTIGDETYNCVNVPSIASRGGFTESRQRRRAAERGLCLFGAASVGALLAAAPSIRRSIAGIGRVFRLLRRGRAWADDVALLYGEHEEVWGAHAAAA